MGFTYEKENTGFKLEAYEWDRIWFEKAELWAADGVHFTNGGMSLSPESV